ncbi:hypothetical protein NPIL_364331 [Nephila pilipes]|uniref:Uncharacterized protein n=1 Tax=Nephila pilipes TaxID=299642 RepID=A0A8X6U3Q0_NEPPI|nr:hypothetical protein NPIL_364331 [Nephila pilipes]
MCAAYVPWRFAIYGKGAGKGLQQYVLPLLAGYVVPAWRRQCAYWLRAFFLAAQCGGMRRTQRHTSKGVYAFKVAGCVAKAVSVQHALAVLRDIRRQAEQF